MGACDDDVQSTSGAPLLDFERFRARRVREQMRGLLDSLLVAIERRDVQGVWDVLDEAAAARGMPGGVREEALELARAPRKSVRAPIKLYRFQEQLRQLDDEPLEWGDPDQLDLALAPRPAEAERRRRISAAGGQRAQCGDVTWGE